MLGNLREGVNVICNTHIYYRIHSLAVVALCIMNIYYRKQGLAVPALFNMHVYYRIYYRGL
jgi:hypothetical protein